MEKGNEILRVTDMSAKAHTQGVKAQAKQPANSAVPAPTREDAIAPQGTDEPPACFQGILSEWGYTTLAAQMAFVRVMFALQLHTLTTTEALIAEVLARSQTTGEMQQTLPEGVCAEPALATALQSVYPAETTMLVEECASYTDIELWPVLNTPIAHPNGVRLWLVCAFQLRGLRATFHQETPTNEGIARWKPVAQSLSALTSLKKQRINTHLLAPLGLLHGYAWPATWPTAPTVLLLHGGMEDAIARRVGYLAHLARYCEQKMDAPIMPWPVLYPSNPRGLFDDEPSTARLLGHWWWRTQTELLKKHKHTLQTVTASIAKTLQSTNCPQGSWTDAQALASLKVRIIKELGLPDTTPWPNDGYVQSIAQNPKCQHEWAIFKRAKYTHLVGWPTAFDALHWHIDQLIEAVPRLKGRLMVVPLPIYATNSQDKHRIANTEDSVLTVSHWCKQQTPAITHVIAITDNEKHQARYQAAQGEAILGQQGIACQTVALGATTWQWEMAMDNMARTLYVQCLFSDRHAYPDKAPATDTQWGSTLSARWQATCRELRHHVYSSLQAAVLPWPVTPSKPPVLVLANEDTKRPTVAGYEAIPIAPNAPVVALILQQMWHAYPDKQAMKAVLRRYLATQAGEALSDTALQEAFAQGLAYQGTTIPLEAWTPYVSHWSHTFSDLVKHPLFPANTVVVNYSATGYVAHYGSEQALKQLLFRTSADGSLAWLVSPTQCPAFIPCGLHMSPQLFLPAISTSSLPAPSWVLSITREALTAALVDALPLTLRETKPLAPLIEVLFKYQSARERSSLATAEIPSSTVNIQIKALDEIIMQDAMSTHITHTTHRPHPDSALVRPALWYGVSAVYLRYAEHTLAKHALIQSLRCLKDIQAQQGETLLWRALSAQCQQAMEALPQDKHRDPITAPIITYRSEATSMQIAQAWHTQGTRYMAQGQLALARKAYTQAYDAAKTWDYGLSLVTCCLAQKDYEAGHTVLNTLKQRIHSAQARCLYGVYEDALARALPSLRLCCESDITEKARERAFEAHQGEASIRLALSRCAFWVAQKKWPQAQQWLTRAHEQYALLTKSTHSAAAWEAAFSGACAVLVYGRGEYAISYLASRLCDAAREAMEPTEMTLWPHEPLLTAQAAQAMANHSKIDTMKILGYEQALTHYAERYVPDRAIVAGMTPAERQQLDSKPHIALLDGWAAVAAQAGWFRQAWTHYWDAAQQWRDNGAIYRCLLLRVWRYAEHLPIPRRAQLADALVEAYYPNAVFERCLPRALYYAQAAVAAQKTPGREEQLVQIQKAVAVCQGRWGVDWYNHYMHGLSLWYAAQDMSSHDINPQASHHLVIEDADNRALADVITHCGSLLDHCYGAIRHGELTIPASKGASFPQKGNNQALDKQLNKQGFAVIKEFAPKEFVRVLNAMGDGCKYAWQTGCMKAFAQAGYIELNKEYTQFRVLPLWQTDWRQNKQQYTQTGLPMLPKTDALGAECLREVLAKRWAVGQMGAHDDVLSHDRWRPLSIFYTYCGEFVPLVDENNRLPSLMKALELMGWVTIVYETMTEKDEHGRQKRRPHYKLTEVLLEQLNTLQLTRMTDSANAEFEKEQNPRLRVLLTLYCEALVTQLYVHCGRRDFKAKAAEVIRRAQPYQQWEKTLTGDSGSKVGPWLDRLQSMYNQMKHVAVMPIHRVCRVQRQYQQGTLYASDTVVAMTSIAPRIYPWHLAQCLLRHLSSSTSAATVCADAKELYNRLQEKGFLKKGYPSHSLGQAYARAKAQILNDMASEQEERAYIQALDKVLCAHFPKYERKDPFKEGYRHEWVEFLARWLLNRHLEHSGVAFLPEDLRCEANGFLSKVFAGVFEVLNGLAPLLPASKAVPLAPIALPNIPVQAPPLPGKYGTYGDWQRFVHYHLDQLKRTGEVQSTTSWPDWCVHAYQGQVQEERYRQVLTGQGLDNRERVLPLDSDGVDADIAAECDRMSTVYNQLQGQWVVSGPTETLRHAFMAGVVRWRHSLEQTWSRFIKGTLGVALLADTNTSDNVCGHLLSPMKDASKLAKLAFPCADSKVQLWRRLRQHNVGAPCIRVVSADEASQQKNKSLYGNAFFQDNVATLAYDSAASCWTLWLTDRAPSGEQGGDFQGYLLTEAEVRDCGLDKLLVNNALMVSNKNYRGMTLPPTANQQQVTEGAARWVNGLRASKGYLPYSVMDYPDAVQAIVNAQPFAQQHLSGLHWYEWLQASSNESKHQQAMQLQPPRYDKSIAASLQAVVSTQKVRPWHLRKPLTEVLQKSQRYSRCQSKVLAEHLYKFLDGRKLFLQDRQGHLPTAEALRVQLQAAYDNDAFSRLSYEGCDYLSALQACLSNESCIKDIYRCITAERPIHTFDLWPCFESAIKGMDAVIRPLFQAVRKQEQCMDYAWRWALSAEAVDAPLPTGALVDFPTAHNSGAYATLVGHLAPLVHSNDTLETGFKQLNALLEEALPLPTVAEYDRWRLWLASAADSRCERILDETAFTLLKPWLKAIRGHWRHAQGRGKLSLAQYELLWKKLSPDFPVSIHAQKAQHQAQQSGQPVIYVSETGLCRLWRAVPTQQNTAQVPLAWRSQLLKAIASEAQPLFWPEAATEESSWLAVLAAFFGYARGVPVHSQPLDGAIAQYIHWALRQKEDNLKVWMLLGPRLAYYYHQQRTQVDYMHAVAVCDTGLTVLTSPVEGLAKELEVQRQSAIATLHHHRGNARLNGLWATADKVAREQVLEDLKAAFKCQIKQLPFKVLGKKAVEVPQEYREATTQAWFTARTLSRACREYALCIDESLLAPEREEVLEKSYKYLLLLHTCSSARVFREAPHLWLLLCQDVLRLHRVYAQYTLVWPDNTKTAKTKNTSQSMATTLADAAVRLEEALNHIEALSDPWHYAHSRQTALLTLAEYYRDIKHWCNMHKTLARLGPLSNTEHRARWAELLAAHAEAEGDWSGVQWYCQQALEAQKAQGNKSQHRHQRVVEATLKELPSAPVHWRLERLLSDSPLITTMPRAVDSATFSLLEQGYKGFFTVPKVPSTTVVDHQQDNGNTPGI